MITNLDVLGFARWLKKSTGSKKRFIYRGKLTKFGSIAVIFALCHVTTKVCKALEDFKND